MNNKNIELFNYVYGNMFENEKNDEKKWEEFEKLCSDKMHYLPYDFIITNEALVTMNKKNMWQDITGNKGVAGAFVILNFIGTKEYIKYKVNEIKSLIKNYGINAFRNLGNIFEYMCNEAIKQILIECQNEDMIDYEDYIFIYADDGIVDIRYDEIKVIINKQKNEFGIDFINNYGQMINQFGNNNVANISNIGDQKLFDLLDEKLNAIKEEMKNKNCDEKLIELEEAMNKKDKNSTLEIISHLASIGSFIASGISLIIK
jgi:hypothetical protein